MRSYDWMADGLYGATNVEEKFDNLAIIESCTTELLDRLRKHSTAVNCGG